MKRILKIIAKILLIILGLGILWILFVNLVLQDNSHPYYGGGYAPDGESCDYGYKKATKSCCDDDDYSCEMCDEDGIYCDTEDVIQGFDDIDNIPTLYPNGDYDCADFSTWEEAQKVFIRDNGKKDDPYLLDEDRDGVACEEMKKNN